MTPLAVLGALVAALCVMHRHLPPITVSDVKDVKNEGIGVDVRATPLPRSEPVATGWRAWLSRHVVSRHERDTVEDWADSDAESSRSGSVEWAPGVHVERPSLDEWVGRRVGQTDNHAALARTAAHEYGVSLRTAQRAIQRARESRR